MEPESPKWAVDGPLKLGLRTELLLSSRSWGQRGGTQKAWYRSLQISGGGPKLRPKILGSDLQICGNVQVDAQSLRQRDQSFQNMALLLMLMRACLRHNCSPYGKQTWRLPIFMESLKTIHSSPSWPLQASNQSKGLLDCNGCPDNNKIATLGVCIGAPDF